MADIKQGRWTAEIEGDFVVFIIGARVNSKWQVFKALNDLGGRKGLNYMLKYLTEHPEKGMLGYRRSGEYEAFYGNMPPRGLGKASQLVPVAESSGARQRLKAALKSSD